MTAAFEVTIQPEISFGIPLTQYNPQGDIQTEMNIALRGDPGPPGPGVPDGGTTGQLLAKTSDADQDTDWIDPPEGDVQSVNGVLPDLAGNVELTAADVGAASASDLADHIADAADPHAAAGYIKNTGTGPNAIGIGNNAVATSFNDVAVGDSATASGGYSAAVGNHAEASGEQSVASGNYSSATAAYAVATGNRATASGIYSTATGAYSQATAAFATAEGAYANAAHAGSVAAGDHSETSRVGEYSIGKPGDERLLANVADALLPTDGVNLGQLEAAALSPRTVNTVTSVAGVLTLNLAAGDFFRTVLHENCTVVFTGAPASPYGAAFTLESIQDDTTPFAITAWPAGVLWMGADYVSNDVLESTDEIGFTYYGPTEILGKYGGDQRAVPYELLTNKATSLAAPNNTKYPTAQAVVTALSGYQPALGYTAENVTNKATNLTSPDNTKYPTTQAVATALADKLDDSQATAAGLSMLGAANATAQTALLDAFTSGAKGLAPASGGGTTNFLRADGTWAATPTTAPGGSTTQVQYNNAGAFGGLAGVTYASNTMLHQSQATGAIPLAVQAFTGQTGNLQEWRNSVGGLLGSMSSAGLFTCASNISIGGGTSTITLGAQLIITRNGGTGEVLHTTGNGAFPFTISCGGTVAQFTSAGQALTGYLGMAEQTAPAAPATNGGRIFLQDNGAGKTQLMIRFATGAAQQIAIEP